MNWLTEFLRPIGTSAIWAFAVYRLGLFAVHRFESAIGKAVDRLRKFGAAEFDPILQSQGSDEKPAPTPPAQIVEPAAPGSLLGQTETSIREWVNNVPANDRETHLVRALAGWQIGWHFETINLQILGSQLALLQTINTQSLTLAQVRGFYDHAAQVAPDYYRHYTFESWVAWLTNFAKTITVDSEVASITEAGREFLKYIVGRGYSLTRLG